MSERKTKTVLPIEKVLTLNNLTYNAIGDITPVQSRILRKFYPETNEYKQGQTMNWNLDVGTAFCMGTTSFISFEVEAYVDGAQDVAGKTVGFKADSDSAMNLFNQATIMKNEIIEEQEHTNLLAWHKRLNEETHETLWLGNGSVEGYTNFDRDLSNSASVHRFCIPMSRFLGFFNNPNDLIPGMLLSGCRLKLTLESAERALRALAGITTESITYKILNPVIHLDMFNLTDEARLAVNKLAARKNGLTYNFTTYAAQTLQLNGAHVQSQVGMAVSHCLEAFTVVQDAATKDTIAAASMAADDYDDSYKFRYILGAVSFPEEPVTTPEEAYVIAQQVWSGSLSEKHKRNSVSIGEFTSKATRGLGQMAQSFERSHLQAISGLTLSGNRVLQLDLTIAGNAAQRQLTTFMKYVRTCSAYIDGKVVIRY